MRPFTAMVALMLMASPAIAQDTWMRGLNGRYLGQLVSGGGPTSATTTLTSDANGIVRGVFTYVETDNTTTTGTIESCGSPRSFMLVCRWRDRHGDGPLEMNFQFDLASFNGRWTADNLKEWYFWNGTRTGPADKQSN